MVTAAKRAALPLGIVAGSYAAGQALGLILDGELIPTPVLLGLGAVFGCLNALTAVGLVLVYRASRVINFSQGAFGVASSTLFLLLMGAWDWPFWLALTTALLVAGLAGAAVELLVLRRFTASPRLVLTVVTIVVAQLLAAVAFLQPRWFGLAPDEDGDLPPGTPTEGPGTPFDGFSTTWGPVTFNGDALAVVCMTVLVLGGLALFLRLSPVGIAIRGAAENAARAEQLGVSTGTLSMITWTMVAVLGALSAIFGALASDTSVAGLGGPAGAALSYGVLLRALAAAVIARLSSLPVAVAASLAITTFEQALLWTTGEQPLVDAGLFVVVLAALLVQRTRATRLDAASAGWSGLEEIRGIPHELAGLTEVVSGVRRVRWFLALLLLATPFLMSPGQLSVMTIYTLYGIVAVSMVVLSGWAGQISLGQFAFVAVGAIAAGAVGGELGLPFVVALVVGPLAAAAAAVVVGLPALRIQGLYLAVTTLALAVMTSSVLVNPRYLGALLPDELARPSWGPLDFEQSQRSYYYLCLLALAGTIYVLMRLRTSRTGRLLIAMRDNESMAQVYGLSLVKARLGAFALSGGVAGFAGVLYAYQQRGIDAAGYGPELSVMVFLMAVLGGLGSVYAVLVGVAYFAVVNIVVAGVGGQLLASGIGVLAVLLLFPRGLGALAFNGRDAWLRRIAQRRRLYVPSLAGNRLKLGDEALVPLGAGVVDLPPADERYTIDSTIGQAGASQLTKIWRY